MALMLLVGGLIVVVVVIVAALIILRLQRRASQRTVIQQEAWQRAQEIREQQWRTQQEQQTKEVVLAQQSRDQEKDLALATTEAELQQQRKLFHRALVEQELARLRRIEDIPLPVKPDDPTYQPAPDWEPLRLPNADLAGRDFSSLYLRHADLRGANLAHANLFMADLSWACLADADLTGADLSAANLQYADLRGAQFSEARFLVSDLQYSNLAGADLRGVFHLSNEQLALCHIDQHTQFDEHIQASISLSTPTTPLPLLPVNGQCAEAGGEEKTADMEKTAGDIPHQSRRETPTQDRETPLPEPIERKDAAKQIF